MEKKEFREDFLQQNSFVDIDCYSEYDRQARMLAMIRRYEDLCRDASVKGGSLDELFTVPVREKIGRAKSVVADEYKAAYDIIEQEMEAQITAIAEKGADEA